MACGGADVAAACSRRRVLDTGRTRRVLTIADIGKAQLGSRTRVRLERTDERAISSFLERGRMHA